MAVKGDISYTYDRLLGINQDRGSELSQESPDCLNVVGEARGFSIFKGRSKWAAIEIGPQAYLFGNTWPDRHTSEIILTSPAAGKPAKILAHDVGPFIDITGSLTFNADPRNPRSIIRAVYGKYIVGSSYLRDQCWSWDGNIQHPAVALDFPVNYQVLMEWGSKLWGIGDPQNPLNAYYSAKQNDLSIAAGNFLPFRDCRRASRLVGMRPFGKGYSYFWGDWGVWMVELTGTYPEFVRPQLIPMSAEVDCASNNSIVEIPGAGFAWMGKDRMWGLAGTEIRAIDLSNDERQAQRIKNCLAERSLKDLYLATGFFHPKRFCPIWSYPTRICDTNVPFREPKSIAWRPRDNSWWPINQGYQSTCEVVFKQKREIIGTDADGYLYLIDYNSARDKAARIPWYLFLGPIVSSRKQKYVQANLTREIQGVDRVMVDFWGEYESAPVSTYFSLKETFDGDPASHPNYDPGGPNDLGVPPDAALKLPAPIGIVSKRFLLKLHNRTGSTYYDGPEKPMQSLEIIARAL